MIERRDPTHILRIDVPLSIVDPPAEPGKAPEFDAVAEALKVALAVSRAAHFNVICDAANVTLERAGKLDELTALVEQFSEGDRELIGFLARERDGIVDRMREIEHLRGALSHLLMFARGDDHLLKLIHDALDWRPR